MEGKDLKGGNITIFQVIGTEESFGGRRNENKGQIQKTLRPTLEWQEGMGREVIIEDILCATHNTKYTG